MKKLLLISTIVSVGACANVGKDFTAPELPELVKNIFQEAEQKRFKAAEPVKDWWNTLEDKQLSKLVEDGLEHNNDIKIAIANLDTARAVVDETKFDLFPTITATSNAKTERISQSSGNNFGNSKKSFTNYQAGFDAKWEIDLFGRVDQGIAADQARFESSEANLRGVYVSVAAEIARTYIELRGAQQRLGVAKSNTENQQKTLELTTTLANSGRSNELDVARAQSQLDQTASAVPSFEAAVSTAINRLGVLTGKTPDALRKELSMVAPLPTIPQTVLVGDAQNLLKRRPDVHAAEANLAAAIADYNVNVADLYPRLNLLGNIGFLATNLSSFGTGSALTGFVAPTLTWSAFARHGVQARIDQSDARAQAALAQFDKTVLEALEEVDNSMVNFAREEERRAKLQSSAQASAKAAEIAKQRYESGLDSFIDLLDTQRRLLETQDALAASEIQTAVNLVAVYKSLGGGWEVVKPKAKNKP